MKKKSGRRPSAGRVVGLVTLLLVVLAGGVYAAGYAMAGDNVPRQTQVAGVDIGGLTREQAVEKLKDELSGRVNAAMTVVVEGQRLDVVPAEAGLSVDYEATVERSGVGKSWAPQHIWNVLTGGGPIEPAIAVDDVSLTRAAQNVATKVDKPAKDATVTIAGVEIRRTDGEQAIAVRQPDITSGLRSAYLKRTEVPASVVRTDPDITTSEAEEVVEGFAKPTLSAPVKVDTGKGVFEVTPAMIGGATTIEPKESKLVGAVNMDKLYEAAKPAMKKLDLKDAKDASYKMEGGGLVVVPAVDGAEVTKENFAKVVSPVVSQPQGRDVKVELTGAKAKFTTEMAEQQKPKQVIGEFTTYYPHADYRNINLGLAASRINGNTVAKDATFSLNKVLGSRDVGYVDGWVVAGSKLKKENAGGISQSATTVFNAAWFAGLKDVEHQPHTMYFDRYPAGRESTIYSGSIDVKFQNDSDAAIYIEAARSPSSGSSKGSITVKIWGTKKWDIESPEPTKSNFYTGRTINDDSADCNPQSASPGFTASYYRVFKQNGAVVKREDRSWKYSATDEIKCSKKP
ncbi:VanW family protein [Mariniluteicoccus endophyticus]